MKLSLFFKDLQNNKTRTSWKWPPLKHFKIIACPTKNNMPKSDTAMICLEAAPGDAVEELLEMANKAMRSKRLFVQPASTSSILGTEKFQFNDCVALAIDSEDPYLDFRRSMEEMVEACGLMGASRGVVGIVFEDEQEEESWPYCRGIH